MPSAREVYVATRKPRDLPWNTLVCRPLAAPLVAWLAPTRVTPDQVTLAAFLVASAAAGVLAVVPGPFGLWVGVLLVEAAYVLDCADGMLARWRNTASAAGHLLDFLMDELKAFLLIAAVAQRLHVEHGEPGWLALGLLGLLGLAFGTAITTFQRRPEVAERAAGELAATPDGPATNPPGRSASLPGRLLRAPLQVARGLLHYPSWIWLVPLVGRAELFLVPYATLHALNALRALASVFVRFGRG